MLRLSIMIELLGIETQYKADSDSLLSQGASTLSSELETRNSEMSCISILLPMTSTASILTATSSSELNSPGAA
jgi:hypothetical protein